MNNQISLRIHSIKCVDETGGQYAERVGNDEIALSGFGIDANANTVQVPPFSVYAHFDDGDIKRYSPPRNFVTLTLANNSSFPKTCSVGFLLAEKDAGDFGTKANEIYAKVKEEMEKKKKEKEAEVMARRGMVNATGGNIRGTSGTTSNTMTSDTSLSTVEEVVAPEPMETPPLLSSDDLKAIWDVVKQYVYGWIKDRIIRAANDDIFPPRDLSVTIPSADFTWDGSKISPPTAVEFRGHEGIYLMTYDWELS